MNSSRPAAPAARVEIARHMISAGWGILITREVVRSGATVYKVSTVARIGRELRSQPFDQATTEAEARRIANAEWRRQTRP